jgi:hypothetical protein
VSSKFLLYYDVAIESEQIKCVETVLSSRNKAAFVVNLCFRYTLVSHEYVNLLRYLTNSDRSRVACHLIYVLVNWSLLVEHLRKKGEEIGTGK